MLRKKRANKKKSRRKGLYDDNDVLDREEQLQKAEGDMGESGKPSSQKKKIFEGLSEDEGDEDIAERDKRLEAEVQAARKGVKSTQKSDEDEEDFGDQLANKKKKKSNRAKAKKKAIYSDDEESAEAERQRLRRNAAGDPAGQ